MLFRLFRQPIVGALALSTIAIGYSSSLLGVRADFFASKAIAQSARNAIAIVPITYEHPPVPDDPPPPGRPQGAGSHSLCEIDRSEKNLVPLIALVPSQVVQGNRRELTYVWGKTTAANPTFWLYLAYPQNALVKFAIYNDDFEEIATDSFAIAATEPGIVSFALPPEKLSLEVNEIYHWEFSIYCDRDQSSPNDIVNGSIQRVALPSEVQSQIEEATPLEGIALYAKNGIWYDSLTNLAELRHQQPENPDFAAAWEELLTAVDADKKISSQPILPCCQP